MKGFNEKGVSPVIATILLIALTVAAVGIVAVILGTITPAGAGLSVTLSTEGVYRPGYGDPGTNNTCDVKLTSWGPDTITEGDISISFEGSVYTDNVYVEWVRGTADKITMTAKAATIQAGATADITVAMWPATVGSGTAISIVFTRTGGIDDYVEITKLTISDGLTGTVLYKDDDLPTATAPVY